MPIISMFFGIAIKEWTQEHQEELMQVWDFAQAGKPLFRIPGADQ